MHGDGNSHFKQKRVERGRGTRVSLSLSLSLSLSQVWSDRMKELHVSADRRARTLMDDRWIICNPLLKNKTVNNDNHFKRQRETRNHFEQQREIANACLYLSLSS
ncbi:hypothetical protein KP509_11G043200 [Ceratopteris richardii]|uniref:Uncharacterized protein n=1 Tax=Ceratopteris richardii TaxID=49495 RepID=A0A8T2TTU5_CERRI|nr:hypothetical protein KP509_11G043200 [Ceratopteris richardii]